MIFIGYKVDKVIYICSIYGLKVVSLYLYIIVYYGVFIFFD